MKRYTVFILLLVCNNCLGQLTNSSDKKIVSNFINLIRTDQVSKLSDQVSYPLKREYPIPSVRNRKEFAARYKEIFDDSLKQMIIHSDPVQDWSHVGWRGIMFLQGAVWLDEKLISVNHQSIAEKRKKEKLILVDKKNLFASVRDYVRPVLMMSTSKYKIRIDEVQSGKYRYVSWPKASGMSSKPDLVLSNGEVEFSGSGGNHSYRFKSGPYTYVCDILVISESGAPPAKLSVTKSGVTVLKQNATTFVN